MGTGKMPQTKIEISGHCGGGVIHSLEWKSGAQEEVSWGRAVWGSLLYPGEVNPLEVDQFIKEELAE
jgi:hypothetical protein